PRRPVCTEESMSRYAIPSDDRRLQVIVGWDAPLTTFFAQVFATTVDADDDDAACVPWVGDDVQALTIVAALQDTLQEYATMSPDIVAWLQHDHATSQSPPGAHAPVASRRQTPAWLILRPGVHTCRP